MCQRTYFDDIEGRTGMYATLEPPFPVRIEGQSWREVERTIRDLVEEESKKAQSVLYWIPIRSYFEQSTRGGWIVDDELNAEFLRNIDENRWNEDMKAAEMLAEEDAARDA